MRVPLPAAMMMAVGPVAACAGCRLLVVIARVVRRGSVGVHEVEPREVWGRERKQADMDSNHDKQNQNLLCYRYTIGLKVLCFRPE